MVNVHRSPKYPYRKSGSPNSRAACQKFDGKLEIAVSRNTQYKFGQNADQLASCLIYTRTLLEYVIVIVWVRSVNKTLPSVKFAEDKMPTFLILREKC